MSMHSASLASSPRLQRVLDLLLDGRERSTLEIVIEAKVCAVNSCIAELRENGFAIHCERDRETSGERVWLYRLDLDDPGTAAKAAAFRQMSLGLAPEGVNG
ncbi:MAG: hypothetical protein F4Y47_00205 [Acidobacteriia bacterium]|nr:hypothetical protein [Terriglobia bacterium]MYG04414.1 hypothetical protein [Terriglobia bacterium]MYK11279.1 hypothetical protein [Terriglobia bacterium]